jgi:hypothetical protein
LGEGPVLINVVSGHGDARRIKEEYERWMQICVQSMKELTRSTIAPFTTPLTGGREEEQ